MSNPIPLVCVGGPTACGKSAHAMALAAERPSVIINADAMQVYRGLPVLTAQPSNQDKQSVPHKLYEVMDVSEAGSVAKWVKLASQAVRSAQEVGLTPILVGGTGMYFKALLEGLADIPDIPKELRDELTQKYQKMGPAAFHAELTKQDPDLAARLSPTDSQRVIRAYAVWQHTGIPLSQFQASTQPTYTGPVVYHLLLPPRQRIHVNINNRFEAMMAAGALDEARWFMEQNIPSDLPANKILGLQELADHLSGALTIQQAVAKATLRTRQYAKRQSTWFRNQWRHAEISVVASLR